MIDHNDAPRFIVFGVQDDLLIETHTNLVLDAVILCEINSCADYKARLWDNVQRRFISQRQIDYVLQTM